MCSSDPEEFRTAFIKGFLGTYARPTTLIELQACKQGHEERLHMVEMLTSSVDVLNAAGNKDLSINSRIFLNDATTDIGTVE